MSALLRLLMVAALCGLAACANKGGLKSPSQIAAQEAKKNGKAADATTESAPPANVATPPAPAAGTP